MDGTNRRRSRLWRRAALAGALVATVVVIWLDVRTGLWQETVILSGIAAGMLTFALTALYIDRFVERAAQKRWLPLTRLALMDILHSLSDPDRSEITHGRITPRLLPQGEWEGGDDVSDLLHAVSRERQHVTHTLARWAGFLASSADVQTLMVHIALVAQQLDAVRDSAMEFDLPDAATLREPAKAELNERIATYNSTIRAVISEIETILASS